MMKMKLRRVRVLKSPNGHSDKVVSVSDIIFCLSDKVVKLSDKDEGLKSENLTPIAPRCKQGGVEIANKK